MLLRLAGETQSSFNPSLNAVPLILVNTFLISPQANSDFMADKGFESILVFGVKGGWEPRGLGQVGPGNCKRLLVVVYMC